MRVSDMGWLLVGSWKLEVSFAEYSLFYRALLQKDFTIFTPWCVYLICDRVVEKFFFWLCDPCRYGVAMVSRIDKILGLFCRISSLLWGPFAKRPIILSILLTKATPYVTELLKSVISLFDQCRYVRLVDMCDCMCDMTPWCVYLIWGGYD